MTSPGQVPLFDLLFGMSWEDPESDRGALRITSGDSILTIASGGCNTLSLLLDNPRRISAVDINPTQSHLLDLKCAAVRRLDAGDLHAFLGITPSTRRREMFESLVADLQEDSLAYWRERLQAIDEGIIHQGRFERFLRRFRSFLTLLQGKQRIERLFESKSIEEQRDYFDRTWNTLRWRTLFRLVFNKRVLAKRGLVNGYFRFDDGSTSFAESFFNRARRALREIPISSNYFLAQYLLGRYMTEAALPLYLRRENLPIIRERLDRIELVTADAKQWLAAQPAQSIDGFSLSNISELMDLADTTETFEQIARTACSGARICFRNLMVPREVPAHLKERIRLQQDVSRRLLEEDRSFVYSRVDAYVVG